MTTFGGGGGREEGAVKGEKVEKLKVVGGSGNGGSCGGGEGEA